MVATPPCAVKTYPLRVPIKRIAVVFRPPFAHFVEQQIPMAAREGIEIVPLAAPPQVSAERLGEILRTLSERGRVDALWLLNDNELIRSGAFISETWRPRLRDLNIPLIVGVPNLVDPAEPFGTMAVVPDHEALGLQAANLIFDLADDHWQPGRHPIEQPLSVKTVVDTKQARERFGLNKNALQYVDRALE
jgi:hypothetical protein